MPSAASPASPRLASDPLPPATQPAWILRQAPSPEWTRTAPEWTKSPSRADQKSDAELWRFSAVRLRVDQKSQSGPELSMVSPLPGALTASPTHASRIPDRPRAWGRRWTRWTGSFPGRAHMAETPGVWREWREDKPKWASESSHGRKPVDSTEQWGEPPQGAIEPTRATAVTFASIAPCGAPSRFAPSPTGLRPWLLSNARYSAG